MKTCIKCGGSWTGREFDPTCAHNFDEAPEPHVATMTVGGEALFVAGCDTMHPTREGAIAAWKAEWTRRRDEALIAAAAAVQAAVDACADPSEAKIETMRGLFLELERVQGRILDTSKIRDAYESMIDWAADELKKASESPVSTDDALAVELALSTATRAGRLTAPTITPGTRTPVVYEIGAAVAYGAARFTVTAYDWKPPSEPTYAIFHSDRHGQSAINDVPHSKLSPWRGIAYPDGTALGIALEAPGVAARQDTLAKAKPLTCCIAARCTCFAVYDGILHRTCRCGAMTDTPIDAAPSVPPPRTYSVGFDKETGYTISVDEAAEPDKTTWTIRDGFGTSQEFPPPTCCTAPRVVSVGVVDWCEVATWSVHCGACGGHSYTPVGMEQR